MKNLEERAKKRVYLTDILELTLSPFSIIREFLVHELVNFHKQELNNIIPNNEQIQEYINTQPYYGSCTHEYKEGIEQGANWIKEQILKNSSS